jgi:hypothetical protein
MQSRGPRLIVVAVIMLLAVLTAPLCAPLCAAKACPATAGPAEQCHEITAKAEGHSQEYLAAVRTCGSRDVPAIVEKYEAQRSASTKTQYVASVPAVSGLLETIPAFLSRNGLRWCQSPHSPQEASSLLLTTILRI